MDDSIRYAARLRIDYPEELDQVSTFFRLFLAIPILVILSLIVGGGESITIVKDMMGNVVERTSHSIAGIESGLALATALMIVVRRRYPRWWFDFMLELIRFETRVGSYVALLTDRYPSTVEQQSVHLEIDYPDAERELNQWLPLIKWFLAIPHYIVLLFLLLAACFSIVVAWFSIVLTRRYPRSLFDFVVGVGRWALRVRAYAFLLVTDQYPPFSLAPATAPAPPAPPTNEP